MDNFRPSHLTVVPTTDGLAEIGDRARCAVLLRQAAAAIAAPHLVEPNVWKRSEAALSASAVASVLDAMARVAEAAHLTDSTARQVYWSVVSELELASAF